MGRTKRSKANGKMEFVRPWVKKTKILDPVLGSMASTSIFIGLVVGLLHIFPPKPLLFLLFFPKIGIILSTLSFLFPEYDANLCDVGLCGDFLICKL